MTTTHPDDRVRAVLHGRLADARAHVLGCLDGLDDSALRRAVLPSGWTPLGLIRHLTLDDERFWFTSVLGGGGQDGGHEGPADAWRVADDEPAPAVIEAYRTEIARSDAAIAALSLDADLGWWPDGLFGDWRPADHLAVLTHMITETATHAGHLDAARELIDGRQTLVLD